MNIDPASVRRTLEAYEKTLSKAPYRAFASAVETARQEMVQRLNRVSGATGALLRMRADLLRIGRGMPDLEALDLDFLHLFAIWFNRFFWFCARLTGKAQRIFWRRLSPIRPSIPSIAGMICAAD